jgi:hypothetical protein
MATTRIHGYTLGIDDSYATNELIKRFFPAKSTYVDAVSRLRTMLFGQMERLRTVKRKGITAKTSVCMYFMI